MALCERLGRRTYLLLGLGLVLGAYLLLAWGSYVAFTSQIPSGNDFYSRWAGTRALLEGKDPYSLEVTKEIQIGMLGRLAKEGEDQVAFAYPLYVVFFVLPLAALPYSQAQALWMSALVCLSLGTMLLSLKVSERGPLPSNLLGLSFWALALYPTARSVVLGQFSILVWTLLVLALWALKVRRDAIAGLALALSTIKPQMTFLLIPLLLLWALTRRRWGVVSSFLVSMIGMLCLTILILPSWMSGFVSALSQYGGYTSGYTGARSPLEILLDPFFSSALITPVSITLSAVLGGYTLYSWWQAIRGQEPLLWAIYMTVLATLLLPVQTGTTNQVLLLLPLLSVSMLVGQKKGTPWAALWYLGLLFAPWVVFAITLGPEELGLLGRAEHPIMFVLLPLATLVALLACKKAVLTAVNTSTGDLGS